MGLLKRNGIFYLEYKDGLKYKRMSLKTKNKELAQKMYESYLLSQIKNKFNGVESVSVVKENKHERERKEKLRKTVLTAFDEYKDLCLSHNISQDVMNSKERLNKLIKENKIKYLDEINQKLLNHIVNDYQKDTANRHIKNLKAFLNFCIKKRYFDRSDFECLTFVRQEDSIREVVIDERDYSMMIEHINDDFKLYLMALWETGTRPNEITNLKKNDIDFKSGTAKIYQNKTKKYKTVYLTDELLKLFNEIEQENLFAGYKMNNTYYSRQFKKLREQLNLNEKYCLYAFRHTFGTRMLNKTKDIYLASKLLGHSDISITARHYINRSDDEIREKLMQ